MCHDVNRQCTWTGRKAESAGLVLSLAERRLVTQRVQLAPLPSWLVESTAGAQSLFSLFCGEHSTGVFYGRTTFCGRLLPVVAGDCRLTPSGRLGTGMLSSAGCLWSFVSNQLYLLTLRLSGGRLRGRKAGCTHARQTNTVCEGYRAVRTPSIIARTERCQSGDCGGMEGAPAPGLNASETRPAEDRRTASGTLEDSRRGTRGPRVGRT
jgi:hypothetical protein